MHRVLHELDVTHRQLRVRLPASRDELIAVVAHLDIALCEPRLSWEQSAELARLRAMLAGVALIPEWGAGYCIRLTVKTAYALLGGLRLSLINPYIRDERFRMRAERVLGLLVTRMPDQSALQQEAEAIFLEAVGRWAAAGVQQ